MRFRTMAVTGLAFSLAGCIGSVPISPHLPGRTLQFTVKGPVDLAGGKATIVSDSGVIAVGAGNVIAVGAGNVIAVGAGNLAAQSTQKYAILASTDTFKGVSGAGIRLETLSGTPLAGSVLTDANGAATLQNVPGGVPLAVVAYFKVGTQNYRLATPLSTDNATGNIMVDPINTMVEARVSALIGNHISAAPETFDTLKKIWNICNAHNITLDSQNLVLGISAQTLTDKWSQALAALGNDAQSQTDKQTITTFMQQLQTLSSPTFSPTVTASGAPMTAQITATGTVH